MSSSTYYQYQDVKVKIAHRLLNMDGWKVYGYHADESDSMTDYYDPAYWGGLAEKNGFLLVVDHSDAAQDYTYTYKVYSEDAPEIREKIAKLEQMTQANGASAQEEETARAAIAKLQEKKSAGEVTKTSFTPGHLANPPRCNWHIEKDGIILDKGTGLLKFANVADISGMGYGWERENWQKFNNLSREEWEKDYTSREIWGSYPTAEEAARAYDEAVEDYKLLDQFNALIARFNNVCGGMVGNSGENGYTYEKRTETKYKKVWKFQKTENGSFKAGQCFRLAADFNYGCYKGLVYRFKSVLDGEIVRGERVSLKSGKSLTGTANSANSFGYYSAEGATENHGRDKEKFLKWIANGSIEWGEVVEVLEPYEVEKYVKVDRNGNEYKAPKAEKTAENTTEEKTTANYTIKADTDTRDGSALWVVTLSARVDRDEFDRIRAEFKTIGGYYSKFKKGFIFREDPTDKLNQAHEETTTEEPTEGAQIDAGTPEAITAEEEPTETKKAPEEEPQTAPKFDAELIREARSRFYLVLVDKETEAEYIGSETAEDGDRVRIYATSWEYEAEEIAHNNEELRRIIEEDKAAEDPKETAAEPQEAIEEVKAEEIPTDAPEEPKKTAYGYTGAPSDSFTAEEVAKLAQGEQIATGEGWTRSAYFATDYKNGVKFVYKIHLGDADAISPRTNADFYGFIYSGAFYADFDAIIKELSDDINTELLKQIPTEEAAERNAVDLDKTQADTADRLRNGDYTREAQKHHIDDTTPELYLYSTYDRINSADAIRYLLNPGEVVAEYANAYRRTHRAEILNIYIQYNRTVKALNAIRADKTNQAHTLKRIRRATAGGAEKSYKILLANGHTVKADADAVRRMAYNGYISEWYIQSSDRQYLNKDERGRAQDVTPEEVRTISHGSKILYRATA